MKLAVHITLVRHAETVGNAAGIWQGHTDSELSSVGRNQIERLGSRPSLGPTLVVSSDLGRTVATASAFGGHERDPAWRELDLGVWDGLRRTEIEQRFPEELAAARWGSDLTIEGGEAMPAFVERISSAFETLIGRLDDGDHAVVVTHGGAIQVLTSVVLSSQNGPPPLRGPDNTSLTSLVADGPMRRVQVYNDATHLDRPAGRADGTSVLLFRHGETDANIGRIWQGRGDGNLTAKGRAQAEQLALTAADLDRVLTSPARRAQDTAAAVASRQKLETEVVADLVEIDLGSWEGLTGSEAKEMAPALFKRIYVDGRDEPRGVTGESFVDAGERLGRVIDEAAATSPNQTVGMFTHGGVTKAYVAGLLGIGFAGRDRIPMMGNAASARIEFHDDSPMLAAYNVARYPHG